VCRCEEKILLLANEITGFGGSDFVFPLGYLG
jgi:hypothetical protein